ncbi:hypothetical protein CR513_45383, partial [Mucuna pruriens]
MTTRTKIDVHVGTLLMEFGDTLVQFNIFEAMKHPTEDHLLFGIDLIDELVEEFLQLDSSSEDISDFARDTNSFDCLGSITEEADYDELWATKSEQELSLFRTIKARTAFHPNLTLVQDKVSSSTPIQQRLILFR